MSRLAFYVGNITPQIQQAILDFYLKKANRFRAYFVPGGEDFFGASEPDFLALEGVSAQPWSGMKDSIIVEGSLTPAAKVLIAERGHDDENGRRHDLQLWSYELFSETERVLYVGDFRDWLVYATPDEIQSLEEQKIPTSEWVKNSSKHQEGVVVKAIEISDLEQLTQAIKDTFLPKDK